MYGAYLLIERPGSIPSKGIGLILWSTKSGYDGASYNASIATSDHDLGRFLQCDSIAMRRNAVQHRMQPDFDPT